MRIDRLTLRNFRNVGDEPQTYWFNPHFTVFIGINGRGKSTILHGLRVACGTFFLGIPDVKRRHIAPSEIHLKAEDMFLSPARPVIVEAEGVINNNEQTLVWRRQIPADKASTTSSAADVGALKGIGAAMYREVQAGNDRVSLPLLAYFGTDWAHGPGRNVRPKIGRVIFRDGYHSWMEMKAATFRYQDWLASYDILVETQREHPGTKEAFFATLRRANPYIFDIRQIAGVLWLQVAIETYHSELLPLHLHSDGIRFFTEMVAELAYRCIVLNGYRREQAIAECTGVVMIDEIDLHLHPAWQRHVVSDLKAAFPNIQFVATTHSPFIVQSLEGEELVNLDAELDLPLPSPDELPLNKVATEIMGVQSIRSDDFERRYEEAKQRLAVLENSPEKELTLDDYRHISEVLGKVVKDETSDPVLKAWLENKEGEEDETT